MTLLALKNLRKMGFSFMPADMAVPDQAQDFMPKEIPEPVKVEEKSDKPIQEPKIPMAEK